MTNIDPRIEQKTRIFVGTILFAKGIAKLAGIRTITVGPYQANVIDREATRLILRSEGLENPPTAAQAPTCRDSSRSCVSSWATSTSSSGSSPPPSSP
ncbi:MAG: hypothetical protein ACR2KK_09710 [Acidimicrobiales bacterium]